MATPHGHVLVGGVHRLISRVIGRSLFFALVLAAAIMLPDATAAGQGSASTPGGALAVGTGEVVLELERFGLGDLARPGEIAGVRIVAMDLSIRPREVLIRLEGRDPDGDTPLFERQVVLNPNIRQGVWLYPLVPRNFDTSDAMRLSAYEVQSAGDAGGGEGARAEDQASERGAGRLPGRLLGQATIRMKSRLPPFDSAMAVIGASNLSYSLSDYSITDGQGNTSAHGHEVARIITGLRPADLPDRWMGYTGLDAVVWGSGDPAEVRGDRAAALREWVHRGGHFIVIMPVAGQAWTNATSNELHDLLPAVTITRHEGVNMAAFAPLLNRRPMAALPRDAVVYTFDPSPSAKPGEAVRVLAGPDGRCVVARRLVGTGTVTLIGLDLNHRQVASQDALNADMFWNRVLGKRGTTRSPAEIAQIQNRGFIGREDRLFESDIAPAIAKSGRSAAGLLLALTVFATYWLVAGPGGFALLRRLGMVRHAWVGFFAAAGVFTAVAWGGALLLRPSKVDITHLTILDHVYGQPVQRARSWMSVLIPWYGQARIEVGEPPRAGESSSRGGGDVILPWTSPEQAQSSQDMFPDARGYEIQTRSPRAMTVPTRSTVKQVRADWMGGPAWPMPAPVGGGEDPSDGYPRLGEGRRAYGRLAHSMPGPLRDVVIVTVLPQRPVGSPLGTAMICPAYAYGLASDDPWEPGEILDLSQVTDVPLSADVSAITYFSSLLSRGSVIDITRPEATRTDV
ncbi:MAG TPA: hypothetical protein PKU91_02310, partial [Phycisphaerales bacterium]|nr:hypothetical protein [Phycisphaerales bacterium]